MGKIKQLWIAAQDGGLDELDTLIKKAVRVKADRINWRGTTYSVEDAKQIHIYLADAKRTIDRRERTIERGPNGND
jgi:hypothetical protein